ncbi:DUF1045 domain-containing protein [Mesorhizobium sp. CAU 1741]|uniref:DUF1045 domain-containing protein n=1 Tax=Mesorhizobium sp. CAU 1741 TaxID=3140366 RepID=UPI00325BC43B
MRYAIYYSPAQDDPLTRAATGWLGRSAFTDESQAPRAVGRLSAAEIAYHTAAARRYGFHATLMAPFTLAEAESERELIGALDVFCETMQPLSLPRLILRRLDGFFALMPEVQGPDLGGLARDVVIAFHRFRAPLAESEKARRGAAHLTPSQLRNLMRWGYPYLFEDFRFHMTLTGRVDEADAARVQSAIEDHFGPLLEEEVEIASLALFLEHEPGAPFVVRSFHEFGARAERKFA